MSEDWQKLLEKIINTAVELAKLLYEADSDTLHEATVIICEKLLREGFRGYYDHVETVLTLYDSIVRILGQKYKGNSASFNIATITLGIYAYAVLKKLRELKNKHRCPLRSAVPYVNALWNLVSATYGLASQMISDLLDIILHVRKCAMHKLTEKPSEETLTTYNVMIGAFEDLIIVKKKLANVLF